MPASAEAPLLDTSAAVPLIVADHPSHEEVLGKVAGRTLGLAGHAAFETYSVLTGLPAPAGRSPPNSGAADRAQFPRDQIPSSPGTPATAWATREPRHSRRSVYDALVAIAAAHHSMPLATRNERAVPTYRRLGVTLVELH